MSIEKDLEIIENFQGESLTRSLSIIESEICGISSDNLEDFCVSFGVNDELIQSVRAVKKVAGQINVILHASGIINSLPTLLKKGEIIESVSLGAGNTGRRFDLETNLQVAEFKFIDWQGSADTIRQNGLFKDFHNLAEYETSKKKKLYVLGTEYPLKFFKGGRSLTSVLSKQPKILSSIQQKYGESVSKTRDYYELHKNSVQIIDISSHLSRA
jgi:hypothetical protein